MKKKALIIVLIFAIAAALITGGILYWKKSKKKYNPVYIRPEDPAVLAKLEEWQDLKFGVLMHWGLYSELGIVESWTICSEPHDWIPRDSTENYEEYKQWYWSTADRFNPVDFNPEKMADACARAGMKYILFTTKHHDGFHMFDTKYSDFSISKHAFKDNPRNNVTKEIFEAFRNEDFMIGAYYSKPDWHNDDYWWRRYATPTRSANYSVKNNPWRWNQFEQFIFNQIDELTDGSYGKVDILWLDGGWVGSATDEEIRQKAAGKPYERQVIDMNKFAEIARNNQNGMLIVNRWIEGRYQDYLTPEGQRSMLNKQYADHPWEISVGLAGDWGYNPKNVFKDSREVIHLLSGVVAKGGNMILGFGPDGKGNLPDEVYTCLEEIGEWLDKNGEAIYATRATKKWRDKASHTWFTQSKDGQTIYAVTCLEADKPMPETIVWDKGTFPSKNSDMICLYNGEKVEWQKKNGNIEITVPKDIPADYPAIAFSFRK